MPEDDICICDEHGLQPIAYVCGHIAAAPRGQVVGFVSGPSASEQDLRDAWCAECHKYLLANGGDWIEEEVEVPGGTSIICATCYRRREADAARVGQRLIYDAT